MQIRDARALLRWRAAKLAARSKLKLSTIDRAESTDGEPGISLANAEAIKAALEAAGVEFINGDQPGVRLRAKG